MKFDSINLFRFIEQERGIPIPFNVKLAHDIPMTQYDVNQFNKKNFTLDLEASKIKSLPEGLEIAGWLDVSSSTITELPKKLTVLGDLYMLETKIESLPDDLKVTGTIYVRDTALFDKYNEDILKLSDAYPTLHFSKERVVW